MQDCGNTKVRDPFKLSIESVKYAFPVVHNDIVSSAGNATWDTILNGEEITKSFLILADEMSDII